MTSGNHEFDYRNIDMSAYDLEIIQAHINQPDAKLRKFKSDLQEALAATSEGTNEFGEFHFL